MRRRWRVDWPDWVPATPFGIFAGACGVWGLFGFLGFVIAGTAKSVVTGNDLMNPFLYIVLAAGFGGAVVVFFFGCLIAGAVLLVRHWPVRRVTESSPDIREVYRDHR